jgi:hypothetical protein
VRKPLLILGSGAEETRQRWRSVAHFLRRVFLSHAQENGRRDLFAMLGVRLAFVRGQNAQFSLFKRHLQRRLCFSRLSFIEGRVAAAPALFVRRQLHSGLRFQMADHGNLLFRDHRRLEIIAKAIILEVRSCGAFVGQLRDLM